MSSIPHTIRLQDGSLCNMNNRIAKRGVSLLTCLQTIPDPRKSQGKRHELSLIVLLVFVALLRGSKDLQDAHLWALHNREFLTRYVPMRHGLPDPTTISRVMALLDPDTLVAAFLSFLTMLGVTPGQVYSFDGKTMRAVSGTDAIRHILSLFSHGSHLALGQIGVSSKENEIPAFARLLGQTRYASTRYVYRH